MTNIHCLEEQKSKARIESAEFDYVRSEVIHLIDLLELVDDSKASTLTIQLKQFAEYLETKIQ